MRRLLFLAAAALLAVPATAQDDPPELPRDTAPVRFEVAKGGRVFWRGELVFQVQAGPTASAEARRDDVCADHPSASLGLQSNMMEIRLSPQDRKASGQRYYFSFQWRRSYDPDPSRLDACGEGSEGGERELETEATFLLAPGGTRTIALPNRLTVTFRR
jgi:hypothetical protein